MWQRRRELLGSLTETVLGRALQPVEHTALDAALTSRSPRTARRRCRAWSTTCSTRPPTLGARVRVDGRRNCARTAAIPRTRCAGWCAATSPACSTARPPSASTPPPPLVSLDLSRIDGSDTLLALVMTCASTWMEAALLDNARAAGDPRADGRAVGGAAEPR